jgi:hypothetical protein
MDYAGAFLGALVLFGMAVNGLLKKVEKSFRKFPWCHRCGKNMVSLALPKALPEDVIKHLDLFVQRETTSYGISPASVAPRKHSSSKKICNCFAAIPCLLSWSGRGYLERLYER